MCKEWVRVRQNVTDSLREAFNEFSGDYSDEDIRLVRIMFISEMAN